MDIGIIGAGHIGSTLARRLVALGYRVLMANSRGPASLDRVVAGIGAVAATVEQVVRARDIVIIAVPEKSVPQLPAGIFAISTAVIVDAGNYYPSRDGWIAGIEEGLAESAWVTRVLGCPVVKAFNNIMASDLATRGVPPGTADRICLPIAGGDLQEKARILGLVDELGFDGIDSGTLANSWRQQPGTPAYCRNMSARALRVALAQAEAAKIKVYRAQADEMALPWGSP